MVLKNLIISSPMYVVCIIEFTSIHGRGTMPQQGILSIPVKGTQLRWREEKPIHHLCADSLFHRGLMTLVAASGEELVIRVVWIERIDTGLQMGVKVVGTNYGDLELLHEENTGYLTVA
jgi:hypothetical protein